MVWEVKKYRLFFLFLRRRNFTAANVTSDGGMTCSGESCHAILSGVGALLMMLECVKKRERERERERERGGEEKFQVSLEFFGIHGSQTLHVCHICLHWALGWFGVWGVNVPYATKPYKFVGSQSEPRVFL